MLKAVGEIRREGDPSLHTEKVLLMGKFCLQQGWRRRVGRLLARWVAAGPWGHKEGMLRWVGLILVPHGPSVPEVTLIKPWRKCAPSVQLLRAGPFEGNSEDDQLSPALTRI